MRIKTFLYPVLSHFLLLHVVLHSGALTAQSVTDTIIKVPEVVINAPRNYHFRNDLKSVIFPENELSYYSGSSLGRFLISNTSLNVKAYGAGGAASNVIMRGTTASHVQVNWNGFPLNSVTLGSCDLSMVPAGGFDRVTMVYGASGALYGSGTFGGAIDLDNNLKPGKALKGSLQINYQSLKTIFGSTSFHAGGEKASWKANVWGTFSKNEFSYYDYIRQSGRRQTDGDWHDAGIIQNVAFKLSPSSTLQAGVWYQVRVYNIPSRIGSTSYEYQKDSTLKVYVTWKKSGNRWGLQVKGALFCDRQEYRQKPTAESQINSIVSDIKANQYFNDFNFRYFIKPYLSFDAGVTFAYITADVSAYGERRNEAGVALFAGLKFDNQRLSLQSGIRQEWSNTYESEILPSAGFAWKAVPDIWLLRINFSKKFRKPTLNDLYWLPGGNRVLKPESGYSFETGSVITLSQKEKSKLSADLSIYLSQIRDMIVWRPDGAYWSAMNYQYVHTSGVETSILFDRHSQRLKYHSSLSITLNRSRATIMYAMEKEVMLYSPAVITSWENRISAGILEFTISHHFTASRHYDQTHILDPYHLFDAMAGIKIPLKKGKLGIYATVNNLTDSVYELIRLYAMPGRYWSLKLKYDFNAISEK